MNNIADEFLSRLSGKFTRKIDHDRLLDAEEFEVREPLIERLEQRWGRLRMENGTRMRIERDGGRNRVGAFRTLDDGSNYLLMPEVQSVEHAERQNARQGDIRTLSSVKNFHSMTIL